MRCWKLLRQPQRARSPSCRQPPPPRAMFARSLPLCLLLVVAVESHLGALGPKNVSQKDAEFERTYSDDVNSELVNIYTFNHTVTRNRVSAGLHCGRAAERVGAQAGLDVIPALSASFRAALPLPRPRSHQLSLQLQLGNLDSSLPPAVIWTGLPCSLPRSQPGSCVWLE